MSESLKRLPCPWILLLDFTVRRHGVPSAWHTCDVFSAGEPWQQGGAEGRPGGRRHFVHQRTAHSWPQQQRCSCPLTERRPNSSTGPQPVSRKCLFINTRRCHIYEFRAFYCVVNRGIVMNVAVYGLNDCGSIPDRGLPPRPVRPWSLASHVSKISD